MLTGQEDGYDMAYFGEKTIGIPIIVWLCGRETFKHPKIAVVKFYGFKRKKLYQTFGISISDKPTVLDTNTGEITQTDIRRTITWIKLNQQTLLRYWNYEMCTGTLCDELQRI